MPIRTKLWSEITAEDLVEMRERRVREDHTLEFKEIMPLSNYDEKAEFLKDVTAMANAAGGTIVYGAMEGKGEEKGCLVDLRPMSLNIDVHDQTVSNLLRDSVQERIPGILYRGISSGERYFYLIRVPQSRLAPHMVTLRNACRFFLRTGTSNNPMDVVQIKEVVMRSAGALERAESVVASRIAKHKVRESYAEAQPGTVNKIRSAAHALLHVIPLYPPLGGLDLSAQDVIKRFRSVPAFFEEQPSETHQISLAGLTNRSGEPRVKSSTLLRAGGLEFHAIGIVDDTHYGEVVDAWDLEAAVIHALDEAAQLAVDGMLTLPALVSLQLLHIGSAALASTRLSGTSRRSLPDGQAQIEPVLLNEWSERSFVERSLFNVVWQAWGYERSFHYGEAGDRLPLHTRH